MRNSGKKGQSMVEYALGTGCVACVCVVALGFNDNNSLLKKICLKNRHSMVDAA